MNKNSRIWLLALLLWPIIGAVSLAGCRRDQDDPVQPDTNTVNLVVYTDGATGCQYLSHQGITPRIAADGKTHMGCRGAKP